MLRRSSILVAELSRTRVNRVSAPFCARRGVLVDENLGLLLLARRLDGQRAALGWLGRAGLLEGLREF